MSRGMTMATGGSESALLVARDPKALGRTRRCYLDEMIDRPVGAALSAFVAEREWAQFHTPENLAKSIAIEAGELHECFQWSPDGDTAKVRDELADVLTYCYLLADRMGVDPDQIVLDKLELTRAKYPVEKARGRSDKYDRL
ncbi:MAG TPA: nucleotide pyrophosphohydrolase [Marmoricola sp.]|nr:nucleotide pyrophosphohydrolase [Marmoricola sp.]